VSNDIVIIDYGVGNLYSVEKAFARLGANAVVTGDAAAIMGAAKVVLPGVGAFGDCMSNLAEHGLTDVVRAVAARGTPLLGICVGLQILFDGSEEDPGVPGLGIFPGMVRKIAAPGLKVPHMGWNSLDLAAASPLFAAMAANPYVYFVHSYHAVPADPALVTAWTEYGGRVTAAVGRKNVQAVQFHPEKSGDAGLKILANFKETSV
jgi:imidazole glycerol phosphate synthase, glutamine amidotransferase subunit